MFGRLAQIAQGIGLRRQSAELDAIIKPEIKDDDFYLAIEQLSAEADIRTALEIGSSSGGGSTEAFVDGLKRNRNRPTLFCMELSKARFAKLQARYADVPFVKCYNVSSVPLDQFPSEEEVADFYATVPSALRRYPLERVLDWLRTDKKYLRGSGVPDDGLRIIKQENDVAVFDMVLIDGSEFTGRAELDEIYGAKLLLLDDVNTFKNYSNYQRLRADPGYSLIKENLNLRNGYAVFEHR